MLQDKNKLLQELIDKYLKMYMKLAYRRSVPYDDVEDVVMAAFMSLYNSDDFEKLWDDENALKLLMARITINKCTDYHRKNNRIKQVPIEDCIKRAESADPLKDIDPEKAAIDRENYERVRQCIEGLKEIWREPAVMYFIEERSPEEICEILGISGTVFRSRISRARKYLRETLKDLLR